MRPSLRLSILFFALAVALVATAAADTLVQYDPGANDLVPATINGQQPQILPTNITIPSVLL